MDRDELRKRIARGRALVLMQQYEDAYHELGDMLAALAAVPITPDEYEQVGCEACDGTGGENSALCGCGPGVRHVVDCGTRPRPCSTCNGEGYVKVAAPPEGDEG